MVFPLMPIACLSAIPAVHLLQKHLRNSFRSEDEERQGNADGRRLKEVAERNEDLDATLGCQHFEGGNTKTLSS